MEIVFFWVAFSVVAGVVAASRGRSGSGYFLLSLVLSPLIGLLLAALLPSKAVQTGADDRERFACPQCAEMVLVQAIKCPHCGFGIGEHVAQINAKIAAKNAQLAAKEAEARRERNKRWAARGQWLSGAAKRTKPPPGD